MRRVTNALLTRRADGVISSHRGATAAVIGGSVAAASLATVALFAVLIGGGGWRHGGSVIVEKETGTRLVLVKGVLHPVLNYASARLIVGSADPPIVVVPHAALASTSRGATFGITGAPDTIPAGSALDTGSWTVCSLPASTSSTVVFAGAASTGLVAGGRPLGSSGLLVRDHGGDRYVIFGLQRSRGVDQATAQRWEDVTPVMVDAAVLGALPETDDLSPSDPTAGPAHLARATANSTVCVAISGQGAPSGVVIGANVTARAGARVVVAAGRGLLVRSLASSTSRPCLLAAGGTCFPIADDAALSSLGYATAPVVAMPASVIALLPRGPTLSRTAALAPVSTAGGDGAN